jgi:hypothetical protein
MKRLALNVLRGGFTEVGECFVAEMSDMEFEDFILLFDLEPKRVCALSTPNLMTNTASILAWFKCSSFFSTLKFGTSTLHNGDTVSNFLDKNGFCFLPDEVEIPPGALNVRPDIVIDFWDRKIRFQFNTVPDPIGAYFKTGGISYIDLRETRL